jgi:hypothetical protein
MGLRIRRGARRGRAPRSRSELAGLVVALYAAVGAAVTWPALRHARSDFLALVEPGHGEAAAGDHLQVTYQLWLVGHRLADAATPWIDPYSFQPVADGVTVFQGWLFGLPLWPVFAAAGPVAAWNVFVLGSYALAGGLAYGWLRSVGMPPAAALAGGLVFAIFPYRVAQSTGHLLGPLSALLPGMLWALERRRFLLAGAALVAIPLSGQLHLALGAIPLFGAYALVRTRESRALVATAAVVAAAVAAGLAVKDVAVEGSIAGAGRSLRAVSFFSPDWQDFAYRELRHPPPIAPEYALFLGRVTPLLAVIGLVILTRRREYAFAALLALAVAVPVWLALGTKVPTYEWLWRHVDPFHYPRVPERLMPIAGLAIAALVAVAVGRRPRPIVAAIVLVVLFFDLRLPVYGAAAADPDNGAYAALADARPGRVLELPLFRPERHWGGVYLYYGMQAPRERIGGYSTTAPPAAALVMDRLRPLQCGIWGEPREALLRRLGVRYVVVHGGLYRASPLVPPACRARADRGLRRHGWRAVARDGPVALYSAPR